MTARRDPTVLPDPDHELRIAAIRAVLGASTHERPERKRPDDWGRVLGWAIDERVVGLLRAISADVLWLNEDQEHELHTAWLDSTTSSLRIESSIAPVADALDEAGIDWRLLKGAATAHLLYPEPGLRTIGDLDVMVRPHDFERASNIVSTLSVEELFAPYGPVDAQLRKARAFVLPNGVEVDVHQRIQGPLRTMNVPTTHVFERPQRLTIAGRTVAAPPTEVLFLHAALHLASEGARMSTLADLITLVHRTDLDTAQAARSLPDPTARATVAWALRRAADWAPMPPGSMEAFGARSEGRWRTVGAEFVATHATFARGLDRLIGPRRVRRTAEMLWPSSTVLQNRGLTRRGHLARLSRLSRDAVTP